MLRHYDELGLLAPKSTDVHRAVANWVRDSGYEFNAAMFCNYHVSPAQTNNPDELVNEVCYPVKKM